MRILSCIMMALAAASAAYGQAPGLRSPRLAGVSFIAARYRVGATGSLFAAGRVGAGMAVVGVIANPETQYGAFVIGPGTRLQLSPAAGATVILAGASASDGSSLRLYLLPSFTAGRTTIAAITAAYRPLSGTNRAQVWIDPLTVSLRVTSSVRLGVAAVAVAQDGKAPDVGIGPLGQLRVPGGTVSLELVARHKRTGPELRGTFNAAL